MQSPDRYKLEVYNNDGEYIKSIVTNVPDIKRVMNEGDSMITLDLPYSIDENLDILVVNNEVRIYDNVDKSYAYSGFICQNPRKSSQAGQVSVTLSPYQGRLNRTKMTKSASVLSFVQDQTWTADPGSLDSGKSSDMVKLAINIYRFKNGDIDQEYSSGGDTDVNFGGVNRVTQAITFDQALVAGLKLRLKYNSGTAARLDIALRADDGAGKPTGSNLCLARVSALANTSYDDIDVIFDTPCSVTPGTKYHIYVSSTGSGTSAYAWHADLSSATYAGGDRTYSSDAGANWTVYAGTDMLFKTIYVDDEKVRLHYTSTSIDDSLDVKKWKFTDLTILGALQYIRKYAPSNMNFYIDSNYVVHFHRDGGIASTVLNACDSTSGWTNGAGIGTIAVDTSIKIEGTASLALTLNGAANNHYAYTNISSKDVTPYKNIGYSIFIPAQSTIKRLRVILYSDSATKSSEWYISGRNLRKGDWNDITPYVAIGETPDAVTSTLDKAAVTRIAVGIDTYDSTETLTYYVDNFVMLNVEALILRYARNVKDFQFMDTMDDLVNRIFISNNNNILRKYEDIDSIAKYGAFEYTIMDERLDLTATVDQIGNDFIASHSKPKRVITSLVAMNVDRSQCVPGRLVQIANLPIELGIDPFYKIFSATLTNDVVSLELGEIGKEAPGKISTAEQRLESLQSAETPTSQAITA